MTEKVCGNCGAPVKVGSRCNNCYQYRATHGVERPVELETKRARINTPNEGEKCINCKRLLPKKYAKLCHACYMWQQRHNGEMRPIEQESKLLSPKIEIKKEPKPRPCQKCLRNKRRGWHPECRSCENKRLWAEGVWANRKVTVRKDKWTTRHIDRLRQLAGTMTAKKIAEKLSDEFCIPRTEHAVELKAKQNKISLMCCVDMTIAQASFVLGLAQPTLAKYLAEGVLDGYKETDSKYAYWHITYDAAEKFIRAYPYLVDRKKIKNKRLQSIAEGEFVRDPWLTLPEAARILDMSRSTIGLYAKQGILRATRNFGTDKWNRVYVYRRSLYEFMKRRDERVS